MVLCRRTMSVTMSGSVFISPSRQALLQMALTPYSPNIRTLTLPSRATGSYRFFRL
jgi:hypothetical protein